jgi:hypothetical protein
MPVRLAVVALALAAVLAGCGGSNKAPASSYVQQVDAVANGLSSVTNDLSTPTDASSAAAELLTVRAALRTAAAELAAITPPPAVRADHQKLVRAMNELARGIGPLVARLKTGNLAGADAAFSLQAARDARKAIAAIDAAGYKIEFQLLG